MNVIMISACYFPINAYCSNTNNLFSFTKCSYLYTKMVCFLGLTLSYKGLLLLFGLFVSYETRSVKLRQINDSRYVGMSIYNVVVTCLITAPVIMVTASQQDASFAFVALSVIFCCFLSMALIFVPKVRNNDDLIITWTHKHEYILGDRSDSGSTRQTGI